jgi:hypothetical protein
MYRPRLIRPLSPSSDVDGIKLYAITLAGPLTDIEAFQARLVLVKAELRLIWAKTASFAIFHRGHSADYLIVGWWGNDNEMFTSVSVREGGRWVEDPRRYSFCVWDLEVFWHERNSYVRHMYSGTKDIAGYRADLLGA